MNYFSVPLVFLQKQKGNILAIKKIKHFSVEFITDQHQGSVREYWDTVSFRERCDRRFFFKFPLQN